MREMSSGNLTHQKGCQMRPIKRYNEGPLSQAYSKHEGTACKYWRREPPLEGVLKIISEGKYTKDRAIKSYQGR